MKMDKLFGIITFFMILAFTITACDEFGLLFNEKHKHQWAVSTVPSTCSSAGKKYKMCYECGEVTQSAIPIDPSNHISWYFDRTIKLDCVNPGKGKEICNDCNAMREVDVPSREHLWGNLIETVEPTCTTPGKGKNTCWICNMENQEAVIIQELGHSWGIRVRTLEPACTTLGKEEEPCIRGDCINEYDIPNLEHIRQTIRTTTEPTCTTPGIAEESCIREGCAEPDITELVLPEMGHDLFSITIQSPTCTALGKRQAWCTRNGCTLPAQDTTIPMLPHTLNKTFFPPILLISSCVEDQLVFEDCTICSYNRRYTLYNKGGHSWEYLIIGRKCRECGFYSLL